MLSRIPLFVLLCRAVLAGAAPLGAEEDAPYPVIARLRSGDALFDQYHHYVENAQRQFFRSGRWDMSGFTIFVYVPVEGDDLLGVAAASGIPTEQHETIASLNGISHTADFQTGKPLLLPSIPGLFVSETPATELERLLYAARAERDDGVSLTVSRNGGKERVRFYPGERFSATERLFFLNSGFRFPLRSYRLTSAFGSRLNPFTGRAERHRGVDLAAPLGTPVYAAKEGRVIETGENAVYGRYVIVSHGGGLVSLYGHLSTVTALRGEAVTDTVIGLVGSTGQSTGPHLHFEIRRDGKAQDPGKFLRLFQGE
ncbi:MAG: M23/M37 peptidase domain protein [Treponematales bacterium]